MSFKLMNAIKNLNFKYCTTNNIINFFRKIDIFINHLIINSPIIII